MANEKTALLSDQEPVAPEPKDGKEEAKKKDEKDDCKCEDKKEGEEDGKPKKKVKKKGVPLDYANAKILECYIHRDMAKHVLASEYFEYQAFWFFQIPQALFTAISSVLAFAGSARMFKPYAEYISLIVGTLSACVVLIQTVGGVKTFDLRADRHKTAAVQLRDLRDDLVLIKMKLKEIGRLKNEHHPSEHSHFEDHDLTFEAIQKKYMQCLGSCNSNAPLRIVEAFRGVETNIELQESSSNMAIVDEIYGELDHKTMMKAKAYDILTGEIINTRMFPAKLPNSKDMIERTMDKLKLHLKENKTFYEDIENYESKPRTHRQKVHNCLCFFC